ncbi:endothelin-converting enzyme 1 [Elysia marginata]|uniref:Endothelin-converting enzyme 1 n=1 Tax=Elysia marginata TaxID=1093978 RepID=A0AAV4HBN0_9GAST|nr:endothelin-converting enzyme 1 [Elysia marginata]
MPVYTGITPCHGTRLLRLMRCNHFLRRYTASKDGTSGNEHVHFRNYRKPVLIVQQWIPLCYGGGGEGGNEGEDEKEVHRDAMKEKIPLAWPRPKGLASITLLCLAGSLISPGVAAPSDSSVVSVTDEESSTNCNDSSTTSECQAHFMMQYMNLSIDPCVEFDEYACGRFYKEKKITNTSFSYSTWEQVAVDVETLLIEMLQEEPEPGSLPYRSIPRTFFQSCIDPEQRKITATRRFLESELAKDWPTLNPNWTETENFEVAKISQQYAVLGLDLFFEIYIGSGWENGSVTELYVQIYMPYTVLKLHWMIFMQMKPTLGEIRNYAGFLYQMKFGFQTDDMWTLVHDFFQVYFGMTYTFISREEICLVKTKSFFPRLLSKEFARKMVSEKNKAELSVMVDRIKDAFGDLLRNSTWMGNTTRRVALTKLEAMTLLNVLPEKGYDDETLTKRHAGLVLSKDNFYQNERNIHRLEVIRKMRTLNHPYDSHNNYEWDTTKVTASYSYGQNQIGKHVNPAIVLLLSV